MGTGWLRVLIIPARPAPPSVTSVHAAASSATAYSSGVVIVAASPAPLASASPGPGILRDLLKAATPVHGTWGSGRLLRTSLLSALLTSNGTVLIGAVTPAVLYADAAALR
jgi:hypothetical protein